MSESMHPWLALSERHGVNTYVQSETQCMCLRDTLYLHVYKSMVDTVSETHSTYIESQRHIGQSQRHIVHTQRLCPLCLKDSLKDT